ncbi:MAG: lipoate--protein ligase family protein [Planctomycetes bacterium]|nr:lipoate--protein ligase family protein [Planctomycetota bacterium]
MTAAPIRLINLGAVPALHSQALYHGLAAVHSDASPDTVVLAVSSETYVCFGLHQDVRDVDLEFCAARGLPVFRRDTGGGAVYIDHRQLLVQWVMSPRSLPAYVDRRFALFVSTLVTTYRQLGIPAELRPINDVQVRGRKISGTGAARIGGAEVMVGNFLCDFDPALMAQILRARSPEFRAQVAASLRRYMSSARRELGRSVAPEEFAAAYPLHCARLLGRDVVHGRLAPFELTAVEHAAHRLSSAEFLTRPSPARLPGVKIHADVHVLEAVHGDGRDAIRVTARNRGGILEAVMVDSRHDSAGLEQALRGVQFGEQPVRSAVARHFSNRPSTLPPAAWADAILALPDPNEPYKR